jgi:hypothetical protein
VRAAFVAYSGFVSSNTADASPQAMPTSPTTPRRQITFLRKTNQP